MSMYALGLVDDKDSCPIEELLNLRCGMRVPSTHAQAAQHMRHRLVLARCRRQAESLAKTERLFQPKSKNWLSFEQAHEGKVKLFNAYDAADARGKKMLLKDCLIMAFHVLQPPDRVGGTRETPSTALHAPPRVHLPLPHRRALTGAVLSQS